MEHPRSSYGLEQFENFLKDFNNAVKYHNCIIPYKISAEVKWKEYLTLVYLPYSFLCLLEEKGYFIDKENHTISWLPIR